MRKHAGHLVPIRIETENRGDRAQITLDSTIMHFTDSTPAPYPPFPPTTNCFSTNGRDGMGREFDAMREITIVSVNLTLEVPTCFVLKSK